MNRKLTPRTRIENLRKEAKRWLGALRRNEAKAQERLRRVYHDAPAQPGLRHVQYALAREYGVSNWAALKAALVEVTLPDAGLEELVAQFLEHACIHYGIRPGTAKWDPSYEDNRSRWRYAARILKRHPQVARAGIHAAALCGDLAEVERILAEQPAAATEKGGPQGWEPLLYVCYGRLPIPAAGGNAVAIARTLLDCGADPTVGFDGGENCFRPLTGAIGGGEFAQPPHPQATYLAALLIDRGADPYDPQALYNTSLDNDETAWLDFLFSRSVLLNQAHKWIDSSSSWPHTSMLDYLLGNAVGGNHLGRIQWLLAHGANARRENHSARRSLHTEALLQGYMEAADYLVRHGALPEELQGHDAFQAACMRLDRDAAKLMAEQHPDYLLDPTPLMHAARHDLFEVAELLLDLGMSPDVRDDKNHRPLHTAAGSGSARVAAQLIERGAEIDPRETRHNGIPLGWALHAQKRQTLDLLGRLSRDLRTLVHMGNIERLQELFAREPELARFVDQHGSLLFWLPEDEDCAAAVAEFLLAQGVDPLLKNGDGATAAEFAAVWGPDAVADLLRSSIPTEPPR
jgi:ankyrin repeat protein